MQALTDRFPEARAHRTAPAPSSDPLSQLLQKAAQRGWHCAVIDGYSGHRSGGVYKPGRLPLTRQWWVRADSVTGGLLSLEMLLKSRRFDLIILDELPCSLARVRDWLSQTPGSGRVLWLREDTAVLLSEVQTRQSHWLAWLDRMAPRLDRVLRFVDSWG